MHPHQIADIRLRLDYRTLGFFRLAIRMSAVLDTLTYREREIIKLRYGIGNGYTYTLEEAGKKFNVTKERVRQIEAKAIRKLQRPSRKKMLESFLGEESRTKFFCEHASFFLTSLPSYGKLDGKATLDKSKSDVNQEERRPPWTQTTLSLRRENLPK